MNPIHPHPWPSKPPLGSAIATGHPLAAGLKYAFWFNEGAGAKCYDATGYQTTFALGTTTVWQPGGVRGDNTINGRLTGTITKPAIFTIAAWITPYIVNSAYHAIIRSAGANDGLYLGPSNTWQFEKAGGGSVVGTSTVVVGVPYLVAATNDGVTYRLYVNGKLEASSAGVASAETASFFLLGDTFSLYNDARLQQLMIYARALSASELAWLWARPFAAAQPPARLWTNAPVATFQPAWAAGSNRLISGGIAGG